jgi:hypothetical protein
MQRIYLLLVIGLSFTSIAAANGNCQNAPESHRALQVHIDDSSVQPHGELRDRDDTDGGVPIIFSVFQ